MLIQLLIFSIGYLGTTLLEQPTISRVQGDVFLYGVASWYSKTDPGINRHTANGEVFDDTQMTCATWDLPFGTELYVINLENAKSVTCRVNDRGPARRLKRTVDLSKSAFNQIASLSNGLANVMVYIVSAPQKASLRS